MLDNCPKSGLDSPFGSICNTFHVLWQVQSHGTDKSRGCQRSVLESTTWPIGLCLF